MAEVAEFLNKGVSGRAALWQNKADNPKEFKKEKIGNKNVEWDGTCYRQKLKGKGDDYGQPPPGSKTELRGRRAGMLISSEVIEVCINILRTGHRNMDGTYIVSFGFLFDMYTKISNKLVGMLLRARRQKLIEFEGEMLYQRRDDNVIIKIVKIPKELEGLYQEIDGPIPDHMKLES